MSARSTIIDGVRRTRGAAVAAKAKVNARARGLRLQIDLADSSRLEPGVLFEFQRGAGDIELQLAEGAVVEAGALLRLTGGARVYLGPRTLIRRGSVLNISGVARFEGDNLLSWGSVVHCAERVTFDVRAGTGDGVTVVDGTHFRLDDDDHWYHRSRSAPVHIGKNVWLASRCIVAAGVRIGDAATVAGLSMVLADVPPATLVAGNPAQVRRTAINDIGERSNP